ncbi:MAG: tripartite tricarboxylate transporter substrate binding protein [Candidatus Tectomicrobia bacterium]|uniref:Tripartite tricarboxylate transporter substrate binding protein n=1 Tax=Tectimicrobiota bacterium TaxID=2528274 RepID=A0A932HZL3_UNCTE|nr:tripartite tricarboxylate transporter substrate binding protein [Candidatus Tectomicrobia bacterium]
MSRTCRTWPALWAAFALCAWSAAAGAAYPEKPIELIVPFAAGDSADVEGRLLAQEMTKALGKPVVPVNKEGAGGALAYTHVKNARPDGYTVMWNSISVLTTTNIGNVPFDHDAFDNIGRVEYQPMPFAVKADSRWKTFKDFVAECKQKPNTLKIANAGPGSGTHIAAVALANATGCKPIHVPVGVKRRNASVLSGEVDAMVGPLTGIIKLAQAKQIRILAVPSPRRNPLVPDAPTAKDLGYPVVIDLFRGLSVPKGTPAEVKDRLYKAMVAAAKSKAFQDFSKKAGFTVDVMDEKEFNPYLDEMDKLVKGILKEAGLYRSKAK